MALNPTQSRTLLTFILNGPQSTGEANQMSTLLDQELNVTEAPTQLATLYRDVVVYVDELVAQNTSLRDVLRQVDIHQTRLNEMMERHARTAWRAKVTP